MRSGVLSHLPSASGLLPNFNQKASGFKDIHVPADLKERVRSMAVRQQGSYEISFQRNL